MSQPKSILERLTDRLSKYYGYSVNEDTVNDQIDNLVITIAYSAAGRKDLLDRLLNKNKDDSMKELKSIFTGAFGDGAHYTWVKNNVNQLLKSEKELRDIRKQEDWANSRDHIKTFLFRTMTTLMIAGTILATGFLAKYWEIPLPMLRPLY